MSAEPVGRPAGEIDLVVEPIRYPRSPLIALLVIALVPGVALFSLFRWSDREADRYEATRDAMASLAGSPREPGLFEPRLTGGVDTDRDGVRDGAERDDDGDASDRVDSSDSVDGTDATPGGGESTTAVFDYRRVSAVITDAVNARRLGAAVAPVFAFLEEGSCGAVSVGGALAIEVNSELPVIPASNQKLLIAAVALETLGEDFRFTTSVAVPNPTDGVVEGDIYLIGGGDPILASDEFVASRGQEPTVDPTSLDRLADAVVAAGVSRVRGTVIGDGTRYDDEFFVAEWADGVAGVDAGPYDALLVNDGRVVGGAGTGSDPNEAAAREFTRLLGERGIEVDNGWGSGVASTLVPVVGTVESVPLRDVIDEMLVTSDNNTAEMLLKEIGIVGAGEGSRAAGAGVVSNTLGRLGLPTAGLVVNDGSGLSSTNRVTCSLVLELLQLVRGGPIADALPIAAQTGTLAGEFENSPMAGRLRAKTGTLNNEPFDLDPPAVKALAGYVTTPGEETIEFVMIANGSDVSLANRYRPLWEAFGLRLDTFPEGPGVEALSPR